jgi:zinc transporter ZupT
VRLLGVKAFSGGVFLATAIIHMMPEILHGLEGLGHDSGYPVGFLLILAGYLVILCFERVIFDHEHDHNHEQYHHEEGISSCVIYTLFLLFI